MQPKPKITKGDVFAWTLGALFYLGFGSLMVWFFFFHEAPIPDKVNPYHDVDISSPEDHYEDGPPVSQDYWYCWDTGDPAPHHLGYPVESDHLCNDKELYEANLKF